MSEQEPNLKKCFSESFHIKPRRINCSSPTMKWEIFDVDEDNLLGAIPPKLREELERLSKIVVNESKLEASYKTIEEIPELDETCDTTLNFLYFSYTAPKLNFVVQGKDDTLTSNKNENVS